MNFIVFIIGVLLVLTGIAVPFVKVLRENENSYGNEKVKYKPIILPIILGVLVLILSASFTIIPTGKTGVKTTFGQIDEVTLQSGLNWHIPFAQSIELVNNKQQDITFESEIWSETSERTTIYYTGVTVTYQISSDRSAWIYANVSNYKDSLVSSSLVSSAVKASSKTLSDTDATNRSLIEPLAMENIQSSLDEKYGEDTIIVNKVTIEGADFEDSYNQAIADKQQAQLEAEQQAIINEKNVAQAQAEADAKLITAQAEADATLIAAQAETEANELLEESLTPQILYQMYIEKWSGELPQYVGGDGTNVMIGLDTEVTEDANS